MHVLKWWDNVTYMSLNGGTMLHTRYTMVDNDTYMIHRVGQNHIYIRCIYGNLGREITKYTVIYGAYIRFWPTLVMHNGGQ
jgi:hypothetical protein